MLRIRSSLGLKITILVLCGASFVFALALAYNYSYSRKVILAEAEKNAGNLALSVARRIEQDFRAAAKVPKALAAVLETGIPNKDLLLELIKRMVEEGREIYGSTVAFEPYTFDNNLRSFAPYFFKNQSGVSYKELGKDSTNYFTQDWYHIPKVLRTPIWTEPYFDDGGGIIMTTYSRPFFERTPAGTASKVNGIITADVSLEWLTQIIASVQPGRTGFSFILSETGHFVSHPNTELIMSESIFSLAEERQDASLRKLGLAMLQDESGFVEIGPSLSGQDSFLAYARIPTPGWSLGVVFPKEELLADMNSLHRKTVSVAVGGLILMLLMSVLIGRSIARPLKKMATATGKVSHGELDIDLSEINREDEVGQLAKSFTSMTQDLKKYIKDLTDTTAAKQRVESELSIAARIQRSMLPSVFPAFPDRAEFDIYAVMNPAKEVGGDFYDFFFIDSDHLCVVIGDVSGKGVPAALFMSVTKYLIEAAVGMNEPPDKVLERVNRHLAANNESCMFVTVFMGILNVKTGEFLYANAGHNPPLIWNNDSEPEFLSRPGGPVVGIIDDAVFEMNHVQFIPGTVLLAYTDGVTEAFSSDEKIYSDERLLKVVNSIKDRAPRELTELLLKDIEEFSVNAPQADDITILTLHFSTKNLL
jgi:sigma-B regulation protein RsbU (phosphoserine phosphatase)